MRESLAQSDSRPVLRIASPETSGESAAELSGSAVGRFFKRLIDVALAIPVVFFVLPPLCLLVKVAQVLQAPGPVFFRQERAGRQGLRFRIFKFRTMTVTQEGQSEIENAHQRIFPLGSLLRRSKLDELPQFINVLLGQMSVVGPRPHHFDDCQQFAEQIPQYNERFAVKPGITGLAQYEEFRGRFQWNCLPNRVKRDVRYIESWTPLGDLRLILLTAFAVVARVVGGVWRRSTGVLVAPAPQMAISRTPQELAPESPSTSQDEHRTAA